jgi:8-oxo-dGTP pyrophosphatase MutT (NUDIX family)
MRKNARAVLVNDGKLLVMFRNKFGKRYYTLVGGAIDDGETIFEAVERELMEEASIKAKAKTEIDLDDNPETHYIQCEYIAGEPKLGKDSEEYAIHKRGFNRYQPMWLPIKTLDNLDFPFYPDSPGFMRRFLEHISQS